MPRWIVAAGALSLMAPLACGQASSGRPPPAGTGEATGGSGGSGGRDVDASSIVGGSGGAVVDAALQFDTAPPPADAAVRDAPSPDGRSDGGGAPGSLCTPEGDCTAVVGKLDGFLFEESCKGPHTGADCPSVWCDGKPPAQDVPFKLTGAAADSSKTFQVTLQIRGVSECKQYQGGTRRVPAQQARGAEGDQWYVGGMAEGLPDTPWNIVGLHVTPRVGGEANDYYLNACGAGQSETHLTWKLNYQAKIKVQGGGTITFGIADSNCRMIVNCGVEDSDMSPTCSMANVEPLDGAVPPAPATFVQPLTDAQGAKGQFLFFDVKDVRPDGPASPPRPDGGAPYDRSGWTASSSPMPVKPPGPGAQGNENLDPGNALDGKIGTRWSIGDLHDSGPGAGPTAQKPGDQFTVDMKQPHSLLRLTFWAGGPNGRNGPDARDYPGAIDATVSDDCVTFGPVVARGSEPQPGCQDDGKPCDQPFAIDFPPGTSARCVRLTLTKVLKLGGGIWWAIDELSVYP
jgi:hypothetical protein